MRGESRQEVERLEDHVRGAIAIGGLQPQVNIAVLGERGPFFRHGGRLT